jgi:hypothetical protein
MQEFVHEKVNAPEGLCLFFNPKGGSLFSVIRAKSQKVPKAPLLE